MPGSDKRDELRNALESTRAQLEATNARIEARAGRNLFFAILSGLVFGGVFLASLLLVKQLFVVLVAVIVAVALVELASAFRVSGRRVPRAGVVLGGLIVVGGAYFWGAEGMLLGLFTGSALLTVWRLIEGLFPAWETPPRTLVRDVFSGLFTLVYVAFLASFTVLLVEAERGEWWVFSLVVIVVSVDVGAYAAGVTLGKHKMTPRISPNKTWEGFFGAAVLAATVGVLVAIFALQQPWWVGIILGVVVLFTATGGDLTESLIKRNLGVKDMSSWIPGHGGFLDRLDSLLPSAVGVYGVALFLGVV
ncbi:phosphatidate cytidylyltransferase [Leucobacter luti]|uniref:Phosphatidate cytidylyltransferase n=1 Tax=Leucobacter luti TaxID=340320 RepID=A0A4R6RTZ7_9MICO|nr:phosphatidate cytidylyltransferase [Leucobacter luti]MCW2288114.1 phosphatidate cytidylyltransferase [Leucobacter luti]QYM75905.1 phosphatidate cytidylyltransferase [Leucobacter luti]TCK45724.1 phosphatidate cytidylyltransferase [Leucobacter luti]TDP90383.1 phosphatidate cytidylyltransferase [Leucobacter luti]